MKVELLSITPIDVLIKAIRRCYDSEDNSDSEYECCKTDSYFILGPKDKKLIKQIIDSGHHSVLEHINFSFDIDGISRAILQEHSRHRIASESVQSSRYTLGKLLKANNISELYVHSTDQEVDEIIVEALNKIKELKIKRGDTLSNDKLKYALPEAFKTKLIWSINARSLRNFLTLRISPRAHFEIRELAKKIYNEIPYQYQILFEDIMKGENFETHKERID